MDPLFALFAGMVSFFCIISKKVNNWSGDIFLSGFYIKKILKTLIPAGVLWFFNLTERV